jgi:uncharacterized protein YkwD
MRFNRASSMPGTQVTMRLLLATLAFLALAAFSASQAQQTRASSSATSGVDYRSGVEQETFSLVNQYRKTNKLPPLVWDGAIAQAARAHSKDMATGEVDFGHEGFGDRVSHLKTVMTGLWGAGENVLMTDDLDQVARNAVALWLRSPHHLENIRGDYNYSGLGVWQDKDGAIYFTQIFVKIKSPAQEAEAEPQPSVVTSFGLLAAPKTRSAP